MRVMGPIPKQTKTAEVAAVEEVPAEQPTQVNVYFEEAKKLVMEEDPVEQEWNRVVAAPNSDTTTL